MNKIRFQFAINLFFQITYNPFESVPNILFWIKKFWNYNFRKIQWPSILASTNSSWLASSNKNLEINQPAPSTWIRTHYEKLRKEDNNKWLIDSKNNDQKQTDLLVTLTGRLKYLVFWSKWYPKPGYFKPARPFKHKPEPQI